MNVDMMNINIKVSNNKKMDYKEKSIIKTSKEDSFDKVLNEKMNEPKKGRKNEKASIQNKVAKDEKKESNVKEAIDKSSTENIEKDEDENVKQEMLELIAVLNAFIEELDKALQTGENSENTEIKLDDIKSQLGEIISFIERNDIKEYVLSKERLEQLTDKLEILLDQSEVKLEIKDFDKAFEKLKNLLAEEITNKNETINITASEAANKSNVDDLYIKEDTGPETADAKEDIFANIENKAKQNTENEKQMSQNDKNKGKFGFFANKIQKVIINDKIIEDIPTAFVIQNNMNEIEHIKLETAIQKPNFQNILEQVIEKAHVLVDEKGSEMTLQLKPEHLGNLSMKIAVERGIVIANIVAENQTVKEVLESNFNALRDALNEKGFSIQELNVSVGQDTDFQKHQNFMNFKKKNSTKNMVNSLEYENIVVNEGVNTRLSIGESTIDQLG
ncbi:flagellar hook-length control protein FliK [Crassaminicella indica]|uniref:Flagellar hook-length control protein FliK n=1 Tax=Crassaminicella indica TaxID=2855394 RepID=A0ABX8RBH7_9CLOT|nr:flagellar hook-length control protein FliK [Crassaminicella indica]QXM06146.1 flagellar hook-length control protein FliK [Crassaminicella indica]